MDTVTKQPYFYQLSYDSFNHLFAYIKSIITVALCTLICVIVYPYLDESNLIMIYLLGITILSLYGHFGSSIAASILSILVYDLFFINPFYSFSIDHTQYFLTLLVMLTVSLIISKLINQFKHHAELIKKAQLETETERFRNILLTSISHDLKTPLTAIIGSASSIIQSGDKLNKHLRRELTENIYQEAERLNHLISNILQIIKLESGTVKLSKQPYSIEEAIETTLNKLNTRTTSNLIQFKRTNNPSSVLLDYILIDQVITNLIENAIKFSPENAPVELSVSYSSKEVTVKVIDQGCGISKNELIKIFDKFYRIQKPNTSGSGLGLAICKEIIQAHHGRIWAESNGSRGSTFCFTLPMESSSC